MGCGEPKQPESERVDGVFGGPVEDVVFIEPLAHEAVYKAGEAGILEDAPVF